MTSAINMQIARPLRLAGVLKIVASVYICTTLAASPGNHMNLEATGLAPQARAIGFWISAFLFGNLVSSLVFLVFMRDSVDSPVSTPMLALSAGSMWAVFLLVVRRFCAVNNTNISQGFGINFVTRDWLVGVPLGVFSQLILVNVVTWPFTKLFPETFSFDEVSKRATELTENSTGLWILLLAVVIVVGAPFVEEILYRGLLQNGLTAWRGANLGMVMTAAVFAVVHFSPIEIPGLFAFALVLGVLRQKTGTISRSIVAHMAFNAAGLVLVALV